jgi:2-isopropylmalate synthase
VHCHNDLGLAVANSIAALENGARQVECTINGIGERAGNAALEEIVMALHVRRDMLDYYTSINTQEIYNTSRMVSSLTGIIIQPNKAIVGENAFAHESGIHQDGMLKDRNTYEIMTPETVGVPSTRIVLGRHSGRHGLKVRLAELGYHVAESELDRLYKRFTELADKKKEVFDDDLRILMGDEVFKKQTALELVNLQVHVGSNMIPSAVVQLKHDGELLQESATGDGPVDAMFNAIDRALDTRATIESYQVRSVTGGREALGEVLVRIRHNEQLFHGRGVATDIIEASARAYLQSLNQMYAWEKAQKDGSSEMMAG